MYRYFIQGAWLLANCTCGLHALINKNLIILNSYYIVYTYIQWEQFNKILSIKFPIIYRELSPFIKVLTSRKLGFMNHPMWFVRMLAEMTNSTKSQISGSMTNNRFYTSVDNHHIPDDIIDQIVNYISILKYEFLKRSS